jgi:Trk K+ transport system NAD-binding subunit
MVEPVPASLVGLRLIDAQIAEKTGLNVVAIQARDGSAENASATTMLSEGESLAMLGTGEQHDAFREAFV